MAIRDVRAQRLVSPTEDACAGACTDRSAACQRRFLIEIVHPDGAIDRQVVAGGSSVDHTSEGMERGGLGSVVRVQPLPLFLGVAA
jgi:hypothetical protein